MAENSVNSAAPGGQVKLEIPQLTSLACQILNRLFFPKNEANAKQAFKTLKQGKSIGCGKLTVESKPPALMDTAVGAGVPQAQRKGEITVSVSLDHSEFVGKGFSFPLFRSALRMMLNATATGLKSPKGLKILRNEATDGVLIHHPGVVAVEDQPNVLVFAIEPRPDSSMIVQLMFVGPTQYQQKASANEATAEQGSQA